MACFTVRDSKVMTRMFAVGYPSAERELPRRGREKRGGGNKGAKKKKRGEEERKKKSSNERKDRKLRTEARKESAERSTRKWKRDMLAVKITDFLQVSRSRVSIFFWYFPLFFVRLGVCCVSEHICAMIIQIPLPQSLSFSRRDLMLKLHLSDLVCLSAMGVRKAGCVLWRV